MTKTISLSGTLPETAAGQRLDQALSELFADYSRSRLSDWIKQKLVTVDGKHLKPKDKVQGGEQIEINAELVEEHQWQAEDLPLEVIYEDEYILVINKPSGCVVHPAAGNWEGTLVNALLHHAPELSLLPRAGIVHRIDKDTTGLLVVARNPIAHNSLVQQLQERTMHREYETVVYGTFTSGGHVDAPIGRHPQQRKKMAVVDTGKPAVTHYRLLEKFRDFTHLQVKLETGRTHQIRVHMAHLHHPVVGDPLYLGRPRPPKQASEALLEALQTFRRQALHAKVLRLLHPEDQRKCEWQCDLPEDMQQLLEVLRHDNST